MLLYCVKAPGACWGWQNEIMPYHVHRSMQVQVVCAGLMSSSGTAYAIDSLGELRL